MRAAPGQRRDVGHERCQATGARGARFKARRLYERGVGRTPRRGHLWPRNNAGLGSGEALERHADPATAPPPPFVSRRPPSSVSGVWARVRMPRAEELSRPTVASCRVPRPTGRAWRRARDDWMIRARCSGDLSVCARRARIAPCRSASPRRIAALAIKWARRVRLEQPRVLAHEPPACRRAPGSQQGPSPDRPSDDARRATRSPSGRGSSPSPGRSIPASQRNRRRMPQPSRRADHASS